MLSKKLRGIINSQNFLIERSDCPYCGQTLDGDSFSEAIFNVMQYVGESTFIKTDCCSKSLRIDKVLTFKKW